MKRWIEMVLNRPKIVIGVVFLITLGALCFLPNIQFDASIEAMIPNDDPVLLDLKAVAEEFGSQELFLIAIESDDVFAPETLQKIARLEEALMELPGVATVQSPFNSQIVESSFFGIEIGPMSEIVPQTPEEIAQFKADILGSPYEGVLVTADGRGAALLLELEDHVDVNQVLRIIEGLVKEFQGPEEIHMVGDSYIFYYTEEAIKKDLFVLVPFVVVLIAVVLFLVFRSVLGVIIPLVTVGASVIWTVAIMVWQGIPISLITMVMPVILVTVGIASSIHILNKYKEALVSGLSKREALVETFRVITSPVAVAALTTSAGFASLITAFVQPMREFGVLTAIGVFLAMVLSLSLVPALLILVKEPQAPPDKNTKKGQGRLLNRFLNSLTNLAIDHRRGLLAGVIIITVAFVYGSTLIILESNIVNYFNASSPVRRGTQVIEDVFGGSMQISVVFDTGVEDGMKDPRLVEELVHIQEYLNSWDTINNATSMADVVRELNQALWDGDPEYYVVPDSREAIAQQLLLFSMQGGSGLESLVTYDYSQALVTARMKTLDARAMGHVMGEVEKYLEERYGSRSDLRVHLTGTPKVMMRLMSRYVQTQVSSLATSTITVGLIVALMMKSLVFGLISLVPLLFTVLLNFGVMGFARLPLDAVTSIIASLAIGIGVDYAVHYISRYRLELSNGYDVETSLRRAGSTAGQGIFFNALALVLGFLVLAFSHFRAIAVFGYLISLTMIVSSLAALLVIPMVITYLTKRKLERGTKMKRTVVVFLALVLTALSAGVMWAQEPTGQQILDDLNFDSILSGSGTAELTLITENARGAQREYSVRVYLKSDEAGDRQFLEYLAPADVRGTKFLSINEEGQESQMWLYMPALGRERRIASHMTGDSFMGTDFTYDEIGGGFNYGDDYTAERLKNETVQGVDCYVLVLTANSSEPLYGKIQMWVWIDKMVPVKVQFFGASGTVAKTLTMDDFKLVSDVLIPHELVMSNDVQGTRTILEITKMSQEDVSDDIFTVRNLRR